MLRRAFNQREGWEPSEDNLPENIYQADVGNHQILTKERFHSLLQSYYQYRKLTPNGFIREMEYNRLTQAIDQPFRNSSSD
jgi:aldehyde:ferredoxin oxidoreductase